MYMHADDRNKLATNPKRATSAIRGDPWKGLARRQSAGGNIGRVLQGRSLRRPETLLERFLGSLPCRSQLSQLHLPFRGQRPSPLPPVFANSVDRKTALPNQRQRAGGRGLVDTDRLRQLGRAQVRHFVEYLHRRVLRGVQTALGQHFLIEDSHGSSRLAHCRAITRKG